MSERKYLLSYTRTVRHSDVLSLSEINELLRELLESIEMYPLTEESFFAVMNDHDQDIEDWLEEYIGDHGWSDIKEGSGLVIDPLT